MLKYNNILVGVQFRESRLAHEGTLTTDSREAVDRAMLLAASEGARLTFVTAFESHPASIAERKAAETDEDTQDDEQGPHAAASRGALRPSGDATSSTNAARAHPPPATNTAG